MAGIFIPLAKTLRQLSKIGTARQAGQALRKDIGTLADVAVRGYKSVASPIGEFVGGLRGLSGTAGIPQQPSVIPAQPAHPRPSIAPTSNSLTDQANYEQQLMRVGGGSIAQPTGQLGYEMPTGTLTAANLGKQVPQGVKPIADIFSPSNVQKAKENAPNSTGINFGVSQDTMGALRKSNDISKARAYLALPENQRGRMPADVAATLGQEAPSSTTNSGSPLGSQWRNETDAWNEQVSRGSDAFLATARAKNIAAGFPKRERASVMEAVLSDMLNQSQSKQAQTAGPSLRDIADLKRLGLQQAEASRKSQLEQLGEQRAQRGENRAQQALDFNSQLKLMQENRAQQENQRAQQEALQGQVRSAVQRMPQLSGMEGLLREELSKGVSPDTVNERLSQLRTQPKTPEEQALIDAIDKGLTDSDPQVQQRALMALMKLYRSQFGA